MGKIIRWTAVIMVFGLNSLAWSQINKERLQKRNPELAEKMKNRELCKSGEYKPVCVIINPDQTTNTVYKTFNNEYCAKFKGKDANVVAEMTCKAAAKAGIIVLSKPIKTSKDCMNSTKVREYTCAGKDNGEGYQWNIKGYATCSGARFEITRKIDLGNGFNLSGRYLNLVQPQKLGQKQTVKISVKDKDGKQYTQAHLKKNGGPGLFRDVYFQFERDEQKLIMTDLKFFGTGSTELQCKLGPVFENLIDLNS